MSSYSSRLAISVSHNLVTNPLKVVEIGLFIQNAPLTENFERWVPTQWLRTDASSHLDVQQDGMNADRASAKSVVLNCRIPLLPSMGRPHLIFALPSATLRLPNQPNFEGVQMRPGNVPLVLEHADDNARGNALFLSECPNGMHTAWRSSDKLLPRA